MKILVVGGGRHQSMLVRTRVASTGSPGLGQCILGGDTYQPIFEGGVDYFKL